MNKYEEFGSTLVKMNPLNGTCIFKGLEIKINPLNGMCVHEGIVYEDIAELMHKKIYKQAFEEAHNKDRFNFRKQMIRDIKGSVT